MRILILLFVSALSYAPAAIACGGAPCGDACKLGDAPSAPIDLSGLEGDRASFSVAGMKCGKCSAKVVAALNGVEGVKGSSVNHEDGKAQVVFESSKTTTAALLTAINSTGYTATLDQ